MIRILVNDIFLLLRNESSAEIETAKEWFYVNTEDTKSSGIIRMYKD